MHNKLFHLVFSVFSDTTTTAGLPPSIVEGLDVLKSVSSSPLKKCTAVLFETGWRVFSSYGLNKFQVSIIFLLLKLTLGN